MSEETVTFNLELNVDQSLAGLRQIEGLLFRTFGYMQRLGLPPNIEQGIRQLQRLTMAIRITHTAIIALQLAAGPIGWWRAGLAVVGSTAAWGDVISAQDSGRLG